MNTLKLADSYKAEHWCWANPDIAFSTGYLEPRVKGEKVQVAGISQLVTKLATEYRITARNANEFLLFAKEHSMGQAAINMQGISRIINEFDGFIPVEVKALPEGMVLPTQIPLMQVRNTVAGMAWVIPYFELMWLHVWKTMDVATNSFTQKQVLAAFGQETMPEEIFETWIKFALHDFGARSTGSMQEAEVGVGHLLNFEGSDNWIATQAALDTYGHRTFPSYSVLALEHNVILGWGEEEEHELFEEFAEYVLTQGRIGSMLIDTYDVDNAVDWVIKNKDRLEEWAAVGEYKGRLVLRPDSGHPTDMPVGILEKLLDNFDHLLYNGYKLLPSWLGIIQGDGNNLQVLTNTCNALLGKKISLGNIVFGEGGELINNYARDDKGWAFKLSMNTLKDGTEVGCAKRPKHSPEKHSKEGYFSYVNGMLTRVDSWEDIEGYVTYYSPSKGLNIPSLSEVRELANEFID